MMPIRHRAILALSEYGPSTVRDLAAYIGCSTDGVRSALAALLAIDLVEADGDYARLWSLTVAGRTIVPLLAARRARIAQDESDRRAAARARAESAERRAARLARDEAHVLLRRSIDVAGYTPEQRASLRAQAERRAS